MTLKLGGIICQLMNGTDSLVVPVDFRTNTSMSHYVIPGSSRLDIKYRKKNPLPIPVQKFTPYEAFYLGQTYLAQTYLAHIYLDTNLRYLPRDNLLNLPRHTLRKRFFGHDHIEIFYRYFSVPHRICALYHLPQLFLRHGFA